jgi:hypothetical protein
MASPTPITPDPPVVHICERTIICHECGCFLGVEEVRRHPDDVSPIYDRLGICPSCSQYE